MQSEAPYQLVMQHARAARIAVASTGPTDHGMGRTLSDIERLAHLVRELVSGWSERIEYVVQVDGRLEQRANSVRQQALVSQLIGEVSGYSPVALGQRWGQKGSRPPGNLDLLDLLNSIDRYLDSQCDRVGGREERLRSLVSIAEKRGPEWTAETCRDLRRFIKTARIMLNYDVPQRPLRDTVCGECGGMLVVAQDACSDVRCVGTSEDPSCGMVYPSWRWVDLLEEGAACDGG